MKRLWPVGLLLVLVVALGFGFSLGGHPTAARTQALATPHRSRRVTQTHGAQAQSLFVPVSPSWWRTVSQASVVTVDGQATTLPPHQPVLFFAWWCPHCHMALEELRHTPQLQHITLVSVWINAGNPSLPITSAHNAALVTEKALSALGVHVPSAHLLLAMPNSAINRVLHGVPTLVVPKGNTPMEAAGVPPTIGAWTQQLG